MVLCLTPYKLTSTTSLWPDKNTERSASDLSKRYQLVKQQLTNPMTDVSCLALTFWNGFKSNASFIDRMAPCHAIREDSKSDVNPFENVHFIASVYICNVKSGVLGKGCVLWLWHSLDFSLTFFVCFTHTIIKSVPPSYTVEIRIYKGIHY